MINIDKQRDKAIRKLETPRIQLSGRGMGAVLNGPGSPDRRVRHHA